MWAQQPEPQPPLWRLRNPPPPSVSRASLATGVTAIVGFNSPRLNIAHFSSTFSVALLALGRAPDKFKPFKPYLKTIQILADNFG